MGRGRREAAREVLSRLRRGEPAEEVERELQEIRRDLEENAEKTRQSRWGAEGWSRTLIHDNYTQNYNVCINMYS